MITVSASGVITPETAGTPLASAASYDECVLVGDDFADHIVIAAGDNPTVVPLCLYLDAEIEKSIK
jgi:hypothetical protein